jgi:hypothetical protein
MNRALKVIAKEYGIDKPLSFHRSRHTSSTLALSKGMPIKSVSKILGHTKITTTQIYESYKAQEELNVITKYYSLMKEQMRIAELCEQIGLTFDSVRSLIFGKTLTGESVKLYSPEHERHFQAESVQLKIEKEPDNPTKFRLSLNGQNILDWFRQKYQELQVAI